MTTNVLLQQPRSAASWREHALAKSEVITDAWEVTKTYAGRIAEWVLFGCMVMNIIEILPGVTLWPALSNIVLGTQVVMLDVGGFSLASMGDYARQQGDEHAARRASITGGFLIGIMILTLLMVSSGLLWPVARTYTSMAEKGLILVRVIMTVIYGHVTHSLRRVAMQRQHTTFTEQLTESEQRVSEQCSELVQQTANSLSAHFTEQVERMFTEHPALAEVAHVAETVQAHAQALAGLAALPSLFEQREQALQGQAREGEPQEAQAAREANTEPHPTEIFGDRSGHHRPNTQSERHRQRSLCATLSSETPTMRNTDIQRKAGEQGIPISPAYISEIRKAFFGEQTA